MPLRSSVEVQASPPTNFMPLQTIQTTIGPEGHQRTRNTSPASDCWRLVHDGTKVIALFRSTGITSTVNTLYCGTEDECEAEIARLNLTPLPATPAPAGPSGSTPLEQARTAKLVQLKAAYDTTLSAGITPQGSGIVLAAGAEDTAKFGQLATLLREAEELQPDDAAKAAFRGSPVTITDLSGAAHVVTVDQVRAILVSYGMQLNALFIAYAAKRAAVTAATTIEAIAAVV